MLGNPDPARFLREFRAKLRELGYVEGSNIRIEVRNADGEAARLAPLARELVALGVDVLVPYQTPAVTAAKAATDTIPIVMASVGDPVGAGLRQSLSAPGGNITGVTGATEETGGEEPRADEADHSGRARRRLLATMPTRSTARSCARARRPRRASASRRRSCWRAPATTSTGISRR